MGYLKLIRRTAARIVAASIVIAVFRKIIGILRAYFLRRLGLHLPPKKPVPSNFADSYLAIKTRCGIVSFSPKPVGVISHRFDCAELLPPEIAAVADVAGGSRTVILGEYHHFREFHDMRNRFFLYLARRFGFSVIVLEDRFSLTPFAGCFVSIASDTQAAEFSNRFLTPVIRNAEDMEFLELVRIWNRNFPGSSLRVLFSDLEHDFATTLKHIIDPYLLAHGVEIPPIPEGMTRFELSDRLDFTTAALARIDSASTAHPKTDGRIGLDFITRDYIGCVVENLRSTFWAQSYDFNYFRQKAILRNLIDPIFLGDPFSSSKVVVSCGSQHAASRRRYPLDGSFLKEGAFLNFDHPGSAGSVFSLQLVGFSRKLGSWTVPSPDDSVPQGSGYKRAVENRQKAAKWGLAGYEQQLSDRRASILSRILLQLSMDHGGGPILINSVDWEGISRHFSEDREMSGFFEECREEFSCFDKSIFYPCGSLTRARGSKENSSIESGSDLS